jgi:hypothetical protein
MKNKTVPEIVVDFTALTGHARKVLSHNVQKNLQKLGFDWSHPTGQPKHLDAAAICFNDKSNPNGLYFLSESDGVPPQGWHGCRVINAATELDGIFELAKQAKIENAIEQKSVPTPVETNEDGVELTKQVDPVLGEVHVGTIDGQNVVITKKAIAGIAIGVTQEVSDKILEKAINVRNKLFGENPMSVADGVTVKVGI